MTSRLRSERGYSLVEVLVAIVILTIAIVPMVSMFDSGLRSAMSSGNYDTARAIANTNLEKVKSMGKVAAGGLTDCPEPESADFPCSLSKSYVKVNATSGTFDDATNSEADAMLKVTVTVSWGDGKSYSSTGLAT